jgi:hypothetical protein
LQIPLVLLVEALLLPVTMWFIFKGEGLWERGEKLAAVVFALVGFAICPFIPLVVAVALLLR